MADDVYERHLSVARGNALLMPAGTTVQCFAVPFLREGYLQKLVVSQNGGVFVKLTLKGEASARLWK